jgi:hypothetical protein
MILIPRSIKYDSRDTESKTLLRNLLADGTRTLHGIFLFQFRRATGSERLPGKIIDDLNGKGGIAPEYRKSRPKSRTGNLRAYAPSPGISQKYC